MCLTSGRQNEKWTRKATLVQIDFSGAFDRVHILVLLCNDMLVLLQKRSSL